MIFAAYASPMPGSVLSWSAVAELMSIRSPGFASLFPASFFAAAAGAAFFVSDFFFSSAGAAHRPSAVTNTNNHFIIRMISPLLEQPAEARPRHRLVTRAAQYFFPAEPRPLGSGFAKLRYPDSPRTGSPP